MKKKKETKKQLVNVETIEQIKNWERI